MQYFVQQLVNGLTLGAIYGLIAIGYTMVYGIIGMINSPMATSSWSAPSSP
jgi:branched-chain amino acid transport system permease protein